MNKKISSTYQKFLRNLIYINNICSNEFKKKAVMFVLSACFAVFVYFQFIHSELYTFEAITIGNLIQPLHRTSCSIPKLEKVSSSTSKKLNIGMLMIYDNADGNWNEDLMQRVIHNREKYCNLYGITLINGKDQIDKSRPPAWSKLKAVDHYLHRFDYLIYLDMDIVIMNFQINLIDYIAIDPAKDFIMTEDWGGVNTGAWITKNSLFSHWLLQTAWNQTDLIPKYSPMGLSYPFEYEQRAFHFLLQTKVWKDRHLQVYRGDSKELWNHFLILPQCSMNSYIVYPFYKSPEVREEAHYLEGDFLVHMAGKKGRVKTNLMKYFLAVAEQ
jgi:hypothetical protein